MSDDEIKALAKTSLLIGDITLDSYDECVLSVAAALREAHAAGRLEGMGAIVAIVSRHNGKAVCPLLWAEIRSAIKGGPQ